MPKPTTLPQFATLLEFYDNPPPGDLKISEDGRSTTSPMAPAEAPDPRKLPRHIVEDPQMCFTITAAARNYLAASASPTGDIPYFHFAAQGVLTNTIGCVNLNLDLFAVIASHICTFAQTADELGLHAVESTSLKNVEGMRPNRKLRRLGVDRVIIEMRSVSVFETYAGDIQQLARANNGTGSEIIYRGTAFDAEAILYKLAKHMIDRDCPWGALIGGKEFMIFYLDKRVEGNDTYHHLVLSGRHAAFPSVAPPGLTCLIPVLIALLLGDVPAVQYIPPKAKVGARYALESGLQAGLVTDRKLANKDRALQQNVRPGRPAFSGLKLDKDVQLCSLAYPNSSLPNREFALTSVSAQEAWKIASGAVENLPTTPSHAQGPHPLISGAESAVKLLTLEKLGSGVCGSVYDSLCITSGGEEPCAIKVMQYQFGSFPIEIGVYEQLEGKSFVPAFYGAFAGMWVTGPLGVVLMERLDKTFRSFDEMDIDEKYGALECVEQLHRAGFHHGDIAARNFGVRNREMVVFDFSHAEPCGRGCPSAADGCFSARREVETLKERLFGVAEA